VRRRYLWGREWILAWNRESELVGKSRLLSVVVRRGCVRSVMTVVGAGLVGAAVVEVYESRVGKKGR